MCCWEVTLSIPPEKQIWLMSGLQLQIFCSLNKGFKFSDAQFYCVMCYNGEEKTKRYPSCVWTYTWLILFFRNEWPEFELCVCSQHALPLLTSVGILQILPNMLQTEWPWFTLCYFHDWSCSLTVVVLKSANSIQQNMLCVSLVLSCTMHFFIAVLSTAPVTGCPGGRRRSMW